ncbi:hypoxic response protein Hrp1 [Streptomyces capparidis]|jgi:CBS domain-containing protein
MTTAGQIMHPGAQCIDQGETLARAAQLMRELDVGALPICDADGRMTGIVTDRDIVVHCVAVGREPAQVQCRDLAHGTPVWIDADADISEVLHTMERHQIRRLPVVENKRLVGMISESDLARNLPEDQIAEWAERVYAKG